MKKIFFFGSCLVALASSPVMAQTSEPEVVVMRVYDAGGTVHLVINRGKGKSELVTFSSGVNDKHLGEAAEGYQQALTKLYQEGYNLKSTFTTSESLSTLIFVKDK
jgi:basic membrane lipoprotein Med (substrate-binding protein (PBP1-ABC) superfamily)